MTLLIYSGLPDPVWTIGSQNEKFQENKRASGQRKSQRQHLLLQNIPAVLGFKGFLVEQPGAQGEELILGKETGDLQKLLLLHGRGGPLSGEVTCSGSSNLSCTRDQIKLRDYMGRRVTPPNRVTSPTWGAPPPCKQALILSLMT